MPIQIQLRRDTSSNWVSINPLLAEGELGLETDTGKIKVGNGSLYWNELSYNTGSLGSSTPLKLGSASAGISVNGAREDHIHPSTVNNLTIEKYGYLTPINSSDKPSWAEGNIFYDNEEKTVIVQGSGTAFELSLGQREWVRCRNNSGSTIPKGTVVYVTGVHIPGDPVHGHHPTVAPADASDLAKIDVIGITGESINNGSHGYVVVRGYIEGIDTSNLTTADRVHLSAETPGGIVDIAPDYPNYPIDLGICLTSDATNGTLYVDFAQHTFEGVRVTNNAYFDGNVTVQGNLSLLGTSSNISTTNLSVDNNFIYLNSGNTIGPSGTTFSGTGVNDATFIGHYKGTTTKTFKVKITINGVGTAPDSFRWSTDNFSTNNGTDIQIIAGTKFTLSDGISIQFISDNGHELNDIWSGTAAPVNVDIALIGNRNTGSSGIGYTHLGLFFDVSDQKFKVFSRYDLEPELNIDTADASFTLGTFKAASFEGDLLGNVTGNVSGNAGTVTNGVYTSTTSLPNVTSVNSTNIPASKTLVVTTDIGSSVQAYDIDLTNIAAVPVGTGLLKNTAGTWSLDTTAYSPASGSSSITTTGTVTSGTWSGLFGTVSGANLTSLTAANISAGTLASGVVPSAGTITSATSGLGYMGMPQVLNPTSPYTLLASDAGKHIYFTTGTNTVTIPANGTTAFPVGTTFVIVNDSTVATTISINTDTLVLAGIGTTGTRSLAQWGMATAVKVTSTRWIISGNGLT